jgi:hypothetical protein
VTSVTDVIGLRLIDRTGKGLRDAPRDAIISLSTAKNQVGRAFVFTGLLILSVEYVDLLPLTLL